MNALGFRRRVLIEPAPGLVTAQLEDDWHRMSVALRHSDGRVTRVVSVMERAPWTTCPGAMERLNATFVGVALGEIARRGEKTSNCTHLYDLAILAAAHADAPLETAYEIDVSDPEDGCQTARLHRDRVLVLEWRMAGDRLAAPPALAGRRLTELAGWIAGLDRDTQEAARLLRWAIIMSAGRQMDIPAYSSGTRFASGACFTFQPETAEQATRVPDAHRDLSRPGQAPLADRAAHFAPG